MATYLEIRGLFADGDLQNKMEVATVVEAHDLITATTPSASDKQFANDVFASPRSIADQVLMGVLAANKDSTTAQILAADDATLQVQVAIVFSALKDAAAGV